MKRPATGGSNYGTTPTTENDSAIASGGDFTDLDVYGGNGGGGGGGGGHQSRAISQEPGTTSYTSR